MQIKGLISGFGISSAILAASFFFSSCTCHISEENIAKLRELRKEESSLIQQISKKKDEKAGIERELNSRNSEYRKCNEDRDFVKSKLAQWPNVWPDSAEMKNRPVKK